MQSQFDGAEEQALITRYGPTVQRDCRFDLDGTGYAYWWQTTALVRRAEVVMVVQRPDGSLLLHAKGHHPPGTYRFPTGGIFWGEGVLDALDREQKEELGVCLPVTAMPAIIRYTLRYDERAIPFASYLFLLRADDDTTPVARDPTENISEFHWVPYANIPAVAEHLRGIIRAWGDWGPFRAISHDLLAEIWTP
jgi:ADP-ribose pyrophosphatase YjhB (NUDIX family)